ncbi:geminin [Ischnura elegans]|uniref:geminin n=1 Tax=Ischnura elegans TaxID=197161 RepID=UPI001ED88E8E|nr:geminin [Ischnura elegans]
MKTKTTKSSSVRKPLNTLEPNTRDKENVGLGSSSVKAGIVKSNIKEKDQLSRKDDSVKGGIKDIHHASAQTEVESRIDVTDLISNDPPSEGYWKMLAEQRLKALEKTLKENEELHCKIEVLERQKKAYREMLDETTALVNVLQEMIGQDEEIPSVGGI